MALRERSSGGDGDDMVRGGTGHDVVRGGFGEDLVTGGDGRDNVNGGRDDDVLRGGRGADVFVYDGAAGVESGDDVIADFEGGVDVICLLNARVEAQEQVGEDVVLSLSSGGTLTLEDVDLADIGAADFGDTPLV